MDGHRSIRLLKNHIYPTYQLHAFMGNKKTDPKDGLRLGALIAMEWLSRRLGEDGAAELGELLPPEQYREADDSNLPSLHINHGFVVDIVSLPKEGIWTLQITEPDLGSDPGNPEQLRAAVAGRMIETNVGFRIQGTQLECGFQTLISDLDNTPPAEVYRLAMIHRLIRHPDFGLKHIRSLGYNACRVTSVRQLDELFSLWRSETNQMPCVVFTQTQSSPAASLPPVAPAILFPAAPAPKKLPGIPLPAMPASNTADPPYDVEKLSKSAVSFGHVFLIEAPLLPRFCAQSALELQHGDIALLFPKCFGGNAEIIPFKPGKARQDEVMASIQQQICTYPRGRKISFGNIRFLSAARENLLYSTEAVLRDAEQISGDWAQELERLKLQWNTALEGKEDEIQSLQQQLDRQKDYTARLEGEKEALRREHRESLATIQRALEKREEEISYLRRKLNQPKNHGEIADWVSLHFSGRLLLHARAVKCLEDREARGVDVGLICDALDFLATDYWEQRYHRISSEEMRSRCSEKYGRPFAVAPIGETTIQYTPSQYKIKYFRNAAGKAVESPLNAHLRVGNDPENLLRIYFLHDDEKQLIVIGSLPRHLRAVSIR